MEKITFVVIAIVSWLLGLLLVNILFQMLWNYYAAKFAPGAENYILGFWEAYGILILCLMLFKSPGSVSK